MRSKIVIPASLSSILAQRGFRPLNESMGSSKCSRIFEGPHFVLQLFAERDGELYMKVSPQHQHAESFFLPGGVAFLRDCDELTRETRDLAKALDENYEGLARFLSREPSGEIEREHLRSWMDGFSKREVERMGQRSEEIRRARTATRPWWKIW